MLGEGGWEGGQSGGRSGLGKEELQGRLLSPLAQRPENLGRGVPGEQSGQPLTLEDSLVIL